MWYIKDAEASRSSFKKLNKNHQKEYVACFVNLDKILTVLNSGSKIGGFKVGFFRSEGSGLYRIGQTGVKASKEVRLYVYPESEDEIMYILSIGTKETQKNDINEAKRKIKKIKGPKKENI
jgi:hypothetical protein